MFFVVDKAKLQRIISVVREDKNRRRQGVESPYLRLEAVGKELTVTSSMMSATFRATVYEEGVLFIRTTYFRRVLQATPVKERFLAFQVTEEGLRFCDVFFPFDGNDIVLYLKPSEAPDSWPPPPPDAENIPDLGQRMLFPTEDIDG